MPKPRYRSGENIDKRQADRYNGSIRMLGVPHYKKGEYVNSHLHLNITYLIEADDKEEIRIKDDENSDIAWFDIDEVIDKSNEKWFREHIYTKLNNKLKK